VEIEVMGNGYGGDGGGSRCLYFYHIFRYINMK
jgi:hypothetical protein